ncbi:hypothetical protein AALC75_14965, partial [Lachnospiraceae bacterium 48-42]
LRSRERRIRDSQGRQILRSRERRIRNSRGRRIPGNQGERSLQSRISQGKRYRNSQAETVGKKYPSSYFYAECLLLKLHIRFGGIL